MKVCSKCKIEKSFYEFHRSKFVKSGFSSWCKNCKKLNNQQYKNKYQKEIKEKNLYDYNNLTENYLKKLINKGKNLKYSKITIKMINIKRQQILKQRYFKYRFEIGFLTCCICEIEKPLEEFSKDKYKKTGFKGSCKLCSNKKSRSYHKKRSKYLSDTYIKQVLRNHSSLSASHIPDELVKAKREQLKIKRYLKEI